MPREQTAVTEQNSAGAEVAPAPALPPREHVTRAAPVVQRIANEVTHKKNSNPFDRSDIDGFVADIRQMTRGEGDLFSTWHGGLRILAPDELAKIIDAYNSFGPMGQGAAGRHPELEPLLRTLHLGSAPGERDPATRYQRYLSNMFEAFLHHLKERRSAWDAAGQVSQVEWATLQRALSVYRNVPYVRDKLRHLVGDSGYALVSSASYADYLARLKTPEPTADRVLRKMFSYDPDR